MNGRDTILEIARDVYKDEVVDLACDFHVDLNCFMFVAKILEPVEAMGWTDIQCFSKKDALAHPVTFGGRVRSAIERGRSELWRQINRSAAARTAWPIGQIAHTSGAARQVTTVVSPDEVTPDVVVERKEDT